MDRYTFSTIAYALVACIAALFAIFALVVRNWILAIVCVGAILVCIDNFFCGSRACKAGYDVKTHYALPPFLKRR